jgi:arylsulfatase A-like enzyme
LFLSFYLSPSKEYSCNDCNVIIVAFDALQTSHVSAYNYTLKTTPNIDSFAKDSFLFENAISPASWTVPTYVSWFTSLYPSEHKIVNKFSVYEPPNNTIIANLKNLTPDAITLAQIMKENRYATVGFTGDAGARGSQGNNIGFDIYVDTPAGFNGFDYSVPLAIDWIKNNTNKKFFMFLHGYDSHGQYNLKNFTKKFVDFNYTGKFTGTVQQQAALREEGLANGYVDITPDDVRFWRAWYDEKIYDADERFGIFMNALQQQGILDKTIIIVAVDHGTEFYEHKRFDHGHTLYQELIHVPLIIWAPNFRGTKVVTSQVSTLDIMPTILQLVNIQPNDTVKTQIKGLSLLPAMQGKDVSRDVYSETDYRLFTHKRAIISSDGWKFIWTLAESPNTTNVKELYNLNDDPQEKNNLINQQPRIAYELEQKLAHHIVGMGTNINGPWVIGCSAVYADQCQVTKTPG